MVTLILYSHASVVLDLALLYENNARLSIPATYHSLTDRWNINLRFKVSAVKM